MSDKAGKWIFWIGTLVSLTLFLGLTIDTHLGFRDRTHPERIDEQVLAGKHAFEHYNCNDCHTILGFGAYYAPDLTRAYTRVGESAIRRVLLAPQVVYATSFRKMPNHGLTPEQADGIIAYLRWVSDIDNNDWPPQDSKARLARIGSSGAEGLAGAGASTHSSPTVALLERENCFDCHMLGDRGTPTGPRLDWVGARRDVEWLTRYLENPEALAPGAGMDAYPHLTFEERRGIGEFLVALANDGRR